MVNHIKGLLIFVGLAISLFTAVDSYAQTLAKHNWYFGNTQRSIRFNRVTNDASLVTDKAVPFGTAGSAVATDRGTGNLLFYTDGERVYDANHALMPNADDLAGNVLGNQPAAITPVPGQPGKYFIFTNTAGFGTPGAISVSVIDMNEFGSGTFPAPPFGEVESKNDLIVTLANVSEGMITLPHDNGTDFWLITQNANTLVFNATLINAASYTANTFNTITSNAAQALTSVGHFAYHEELKKLAAAPSDANTNAIIINFNELNGQMVYERDIVNTAVASSAGPAIYDIEWSRSGRFIYLSRHGELGIGGQVFQFDYQNRTTTLAPILPTPVFRSYGLQRGPDSLIYHLYQLSSGSPFALGRINQPDSVAARAQYTNAPAGFAGLNFDGRQFPGFVPDSDINLNLDFTFVGTCQNSPTTFFPFVRPGADSLQWSFGDDSGASRWSPIHTYEEAGSYSVTLRAYYQGQVDSVSKPVPIQTFALQLQLVQDTTACKEEFPPPRGSSSPTQFSVKVTVQGGTPSSIVWSNGDLGETLTPDSAGYYYVVVTDAGGCSAYAGVNVKEYGLQSQIYNKWYFGNKAGIDFTKQPAEALAESAMDAPEGVAIACDRNGQQIFYTDGQTVWDKTHAIIATDIGGNQRAAQSALVIPVPGDETIYYIFTTQDFNGTDSLQLKYSLFDLKENNGTGAVVKQEVLLYMKNTERITANGQWLIVHELGNSIFRSYPISAEGIGNQVYSDVGSKHSAAIQGNADGYMKLGPRNLVAVPISTPGVSGKIEVFQLNDSTGTLSDHKSVEIDEDNGTIYGVEFSPAGNKLFASVKTGGTSLIYEYSIDSLFRVRFRQKIPVAAELGAIQIAPDGQLYVAVNNGGNNTMLGIIAANEDTLATSSFNLSGFALAAGTNSWLGLPNFLQVNSTPLGGPGITVTGLCASDSTRFSGSPRDQIDEFSWTIFRNGQVVASSTQASFAALLPGPGDYRATMQLHNRCDTDVVFSKDFKITPPPADPSRGYPLCNSPTVDIDANPGDVAGLSYQWATGETSELLTIDEQGIYVVDITDVIGCTTRGTFIAADSRPLFELGPDLTLCEGVNEEALNVMNPGMDYVWTINSAPASTTAIQAVDTDTPGVFDYAVTVTDPVTGCFRTEDKEYTITVSPEIRMDGVNPTSCGAGDGSVTVHIDPSVPAGGPLYSYLITGPDGSDNGSEQPSGTSFTLNNISAGTYSGVVIDQVSGCTSQEAFGLSDAVYTANATPDPPNCEPVILTVATTGASLPLTFTTTNSATGETTTGSAVTAAFQTVGLEQGTYVIEITDNGGCIRTVDEVITPNPELTITLTPDLCAMTLTASGGTTYDWSATPASAFAIPPGTGPTAQLAPDAGNVTFTVTGSGAACPGTESITLDVQTIPTPTLTQSDACADNALITVDPDGNFNYRWFVNGTFDVGLGGPTVQINRDNNGDVYSVTIYEPQSGCIRNSNQLPAEVVGPVDATLTSSPPCADGEPITLTALTTEPSGASYAWSRDGAALTDVTTASTEQNDEGSYTVVVSKGSCDATSTLVVRRNPLPEGDLPNQAIICDDPENTDEETRQVELDPGAFIEYAWIKNEVSLGITDRVLIADSKGDYAVTVTDARGCKNTDKTEVLNECIPKVDAPNAFRPGSLIFNPDRKDLTNSDFWIYSRFIDDEQFKVFIFNRWGEMVYSSTDRFFKWNGGYNNNVGQPLPPGTYSYVVQYVSAFRPSDGVKEKRGGVALIR